MRTAGLTLIEPASKFESNLPKTCRSLSARSKPYLVLAHCFKSSVMSIRGVGLATFDSPDLFPSSRWGILLHISRSKCSIRKLSMSVPLFSPCNFPTVLYDVQLGFIKDVIGFQPFLA